MALSRGVDQVCYPFRINALAPCGRPRPCSRNAARRGTAQRGLVAGVIRSACSLGRVSSVIPSVAFRVQQRSIRPLLRMDFVQLAPLSLEVIDGPYDLWEEAAKETLELILDSDKQPMILLDRYEVVIAAVVQHTAT